MSRVKVVVTIGPRTNTATAVRSLVEAGADVMRLNGSHADLAWHADTVRLVREVAPQLPILFDVPGREVRIRHLRHEPAFNLGDRVVLTTEAHHDGTLKVPVSHPTLHEVVSPGDTILADDGQLRFKVQEVTGQDIACRAETAGILRSAKGLSIPGVALGVTPLLARDQRFLAFAKDHGVDFIGVSSVESAEEVHGLRAAMGEAAPRLISKIENRRAIESLEAILEASDGVMIDRGDLSMEMGLHRVALFQRQIVSAARRAGRPVIVATEMLHSMLSSPVPTKAEISDISHTVLDGASATMLSGETAIGQFPTEAVAIMRQVADAAAAHLQATLDADHEPIHHSVPHAIEDAIALICRRLPVTKIVAITRSGYAARMVAARMPRQPILAVSNDPAAARSFQLFPGTEGVHVDIPFSWTSLDHLPKCLEALWRIGKLTDEDLVLVTAVGYPRSGNRMNLIQTHHVADLRESLGWPPR